MNSFLVSLLYLVTASSTLLSDTGCHCSLTRPVNASPTVPLGCSPKVDWSGSVSPWCIVDRCAIFYTGFGYADSCAQTGFTALTVNQQTFYTGQNISLTWSSNGLAADELVKITYQGATSLRTLTPTSGINASLGYFSTPISDSATSITTSAPVVISSVSPAVNLLSSPITILQSKIVNFTVYDGSRIVGTGAAAATCDDRNLGIVWSGIGQAQIGVATLLIRSNGGGGGTTVGTPLTVAVGPSMNLSYLLPRTFTPFAFGTYSAQLSIQGPGAPYTATSAQFNLNAAPSVTPSSTPSVTSSFLPSSSSTPTPSPSISPSETSSPSSTPTPRTIIDATSIAAESAKTTTVIVGAVVGSVAVLLIVIAIYIGIQQREAREKRLRRARSTRQYIEGNSRQAVYGISKEEKNSYVVYQARGRPLSRPTKPSASESSSV